MVLRPGKHARSTPPLRWAGRSSRFCPCGKGGGVSAGQGRCASSEISSTRVLTRMPGGEHQERHEGAQEPPSSQHSNPPLSWVWCLSVSSRFCVPTSCLQRAPAHAKSVIRSGAGLFRRGLQALAPLRSPLRSRSPRTAILLVSSRLVSFGSSKIASWLHLGLQESRIGFGRSFSRKVWGEVLGWECDHNRLDREHKPGRSIGSGRGLEDGSRGVVWSAKVATT